MNISNGNDLFLNSDKFNPAMVDPASPMLAHFDENTLMSISTLIDILPSGCQITSSNSLGRYIEQQSIGEYMSVNEKIDYYYFNNISQMNNSGQYFIICDSLLYSRGFDPYSRSPVTLSNNHELIGIFNNNSYSTNKLFEN